jgi:hypothetical protein
VAYNFEQEHPDIDTHEIFFNEEIAPKLMRVEPLRRMFFALALETAHNLEYCNQALINANRPDLVIEHRAEMVDIRTPAFMGLADTYHGEATRSPSKLFKGNNYIHNFRFIGQGDVAQRIQELKAGKNFIRPTFIMPKVKPSTQRMLVIPEFSDFTNELIEDMTSDHDIQNLKHHHDQRLFIAYQIQRLLVDVKDPGVMRPDYTIETRYLTM